MEQFCASPERFVQFIAVDDAGVAVGLAEASLRSDHVNGTASSPVAFLEGLYVVPEARRRGAARSLVENVERWARSVGCRELASDAQFENELSHTVHASLGFGETERVVYFRKELKSHDVDNTLEPMRIEIDDLSRPAIHALLNEHLQSMYELSPPESVHALDLQTLRKPEITFWSAWEGSLVLGCGALMELGRKHGEVKSMRTPTALRRKGAGRAILSHIIEVARSRSYERLSLETGSMEAFAPARRLYESFGFEYCGPFADYTEDPNSVFMTMRL
jgi:putative acetyltransferase